MKLLNIGCGSVRPGDPWINLDNLHTQLAHGTPERANLDKETNYVEHELCTTMMPFANETFNGILCSHVIEHFDAQDSVKILQDCHRLLKLNGVLIVSVPDAEYFWSVRNKDTPDNAVKLFGEPICPDEPWHKSFFDYALFYHQHKQVLTETSVKCLLLKAGFSFFERASTAPFISDLMISMGAIMNRRRFSLEMVALKYASP
jgi:predicted SAM-dependent methyltransferase